MNTQFHMYTSKDEKPHAFVLRRLDSKPDIEDIRSNLIEEYELKVVKFYKLKTKYRTYFM